MANIVVSQTLPISSNVGYSIPLLFDQYVTQANVLETLSNVSYTKISTLRTGTMFSAFPTTANVGYTILPLYDRYVTQANVLETLSNVSYSKLTGTVSGQLFLNAKQPVPIPTYPATDGAAISTSGSSTQQVTVAAPSVQYWSS